MQWNPSPETKEQVKFYLYCLQATAIVFAGLWVAATFHWHQADAVRRELSKPYDERQLALYLDAAKVVAQLASPEIKEKTKAEERFWELYYGELAFVETTIVKNGDSSMESMMFKFCQQYFERAKCQAQPNSRLSSALSLSHLAAKEMRAKWARE